MRKSCSTFLSLASLISKIRSPTSPLLLAANSSNSLKVSIVPLSEIYEVNSLIASLIYFYTDPSPEPLRISRATLLASAFAITSDNSAGTLPEKINPL
jgi:hypothetical protein